MSRILACLIIVACALPVGAAAQMNPVDIQEWDVPWENSRPRDPYVESANSVWFVGQRGHYLANLNPQTGEFVHHRPLEDMAGPHNLIVGADGTVWYAGNLKGYIGHYDPVTGRIQKTPMPNPAAKDPHTLVFDKGERHIFFTVQFTNFVGRMSLKDRSVDLIEVPTDRARPYGIKMAPDGTPWIALFGTNKLAKINRGDMTLTEYTLPREDARPRRIGVTSDGRIWYVDYARGYLGVFDPETEQVADEWPMPDGGDARPYGMAVDSRDRIWFVETGVTPNLFVGFDPDGEEFFSITPVPSGGGTVRHMDYHKPTGTIWFGTDANTVGRAKVEAAGQAQAE